MPSLGQEMPGKRLPEDARRRQLLEAAFAVACRKGIPGVTIRAVAAQAQVSHALVIFHFGQKNRLVDELLDWLIENTSVLRISEDVARFPRALDRLHALLQQEVDRLIHQPEHTRVFLEFWALGARRQALRARIRAELGRYRAAFLAIFEEILRDGPVRADVTATALASATVTWLQGCAVQALLEPDYFG
jgi:TetR/AcrR family transcriptional repressor of bet genes